jgi:eukaryotic-like serine/threonine-protein kinase
MQCSYCNAENSPAAVNCAACGKTLPSSEATLIPSDATLIPAESPKPRQTTSAQEDPLGTLVDNKTPGTPGGWSIANTPSSTLGSSPGDFESGSIIGERYEILAILGQGGMGTVYKAHDNELDRLVALKVIRPELTTDPEMLRRFKQELILARQVTHRNVIRIFDLGQAGGVKFITMEYVEGQDLRSVLKEKGKLSPEEAGRIILQICRALEAAHGEGVVHRDLKPQNIMMDPTGRAYVMDFGIARSASLPGMTQTGALIGTPEYMSPEQAKGEKLDERSDLFSLGVILYELLTGQSPYYSETPLATLWKRIQEKAKPLSEVDPSLPKQVSDIVEKALEIEPENRFANAKEFGNYIEVWLGISMATLSPIQFPVAAPVAAKKILPWKYFAAGASALLLLAVSGFALRGKLFTGSSAKAGAPAGPEISLAILPFQNSSGDPSLDWLGANLAEMLSSEVGQSARLHIISPDRVHQIISDLKIAPGTSIDPAMVSRIAEFTSADTVVRGQYAKFGNKIRIDATVLDLKRNSSAPLKIEAASESEIPGTVDGLAELIRKNLAVSQDALKDLKASSFRPSSKSIPALRAYNEGLQLVREGKNLDASKTFQAAVQADPQFALAYSRLAEAESALGFDSDAEGNSRKAVDLSQQLPTAEKYLIAATNARIVKDNKKAIESYEDLSKIFPDNEDVEYALGSLYVEKGDYDNARAQFSKILQSDPKNIKALWQMGVVEIKNSRPQAALDPLSKGLSLAVQLDNPEQQALLLQATGISYRLLNKPDEAMRNYQQSMDISRRLGMKRLLAVNLVEMALVQISLGKPDAALSDYEQALKIQNEIGVKKEVGDTLIDMAIVYQERGQYDKSLELLKQSLQIQRDTGDQTYQALCLNNIGAVYLSKGDSDDAFTYFQQALQMREKLGSPGDIADSLHGLGEAYEATGQYDQALSSFLRATDLWRKAGDTRGAAVESHEMGLVFRYQDRIGAALSAMQDAVKSFRDLKDRSRDMAEMLTDLGGTLAKAGRGAEADKLLEEAKGMAVDLKNDSLQAAILNAQGDSQFYRGDLKGAKTSYDQALLMASRGSEQDKVLIAKSNQYKLAIAEGRSQSVINDLRTLSQQADKRGIKYLALQSSVDMATAMINNKDYSRAGQELDKLLGTSEKSGLRLQTAKIHFLRGNLLRQNGKNADAASQYQQMITILDELKKEPGAEHLLERFDLRPIYEEASQRARNSSG